MSKKGEGEAAAAPVKGYLVKNALLSVRVSTDPRAAEYEQFVEWTAGDVMTEWPRHTAIGEWLAAGHIEEVA